MSMVFSRIIFPFLIDIGHIGHKSTVRIGAPRIALTAKALKEDRQRGNYLAYQECQISRPLPLELIAESQILPKPVVGSRRLQNQDFALLSNWVANPG